MKKENDRFIPINSVGYIYDLYFPFILHYNKDKGFSELVNYKKPIADSDFFSELVDECGPFAPSLAPFFSQKDNSQCFMLTCFFGKNKLSESDTLDSLCKELSDVDGVFSKMLEYYFPRADRSGLTKSNIAEIGVLVRESSLDDTVKSGLFSFFIDPDSSVALLCSALRERAEIIEKRREESVTELYSSVPDINSEELLNRIARVKSFSKLPEKLYISFCAAAKNTVEFVSDGKNVTLILGFDYMCALESMEYRKRPELDSFGNAISEKNRVEILELMKRNGSVTIRDIEKELGLTGTNSYYHLSLMLRTGMIKTRNVGRVVFYSIDSDYFGTIINMLKNFAE